MSEWYNSQRSLYITRIESGAGVDGVGKAPSEDTLVGAHRFHTLTQHHQGLVDVTCFTQAFARGMCVLCPFRAGKVDQGET